MSDFTDVVEVGVPGPVGPQGPEGPPGGGGGGAVDSVIDDGATTDVDNTDPANPIVAVRAGVFDDAGAAADVAADLATHEALTTAAHGGLVASTDPRLTDARTPTGAAGGVLSGTYPNPGFAVDMATQTELDAEATARANADNLRQLLSEKGAANGYASLDGSGFVPDAQLASTIARDSEVSSAVAAEATARDSAIATAVANLIASAPGALDTLNELAAALGNDPNFATTVTNALAGKLATTGHDANSIVASIAGTLADLDIPASTFVGRKASGNVLPMTVAEAKTLLAIAAGDVSGLGALATLSAVGSAQITDASIATGDLADDAVTNAKLANVATSTIKGRTTAGTGDPEDLTATQARTVLGLGAVALLASIATANIDNDAVDNTKLANMAQSTIKGRAAGAGTGDPNDLTAAQVKTILALVAADISDFDTQVATTAILKSLIDAKGDLLVGTADNTVARLAVGADNLRLAADSSATSGLRWVGLGALSAVYLASGYVTTPHSTRTTTAPGTGKELLVPLWVGRSVTANRIGIEVTTNTANSTARLGIYQSKSGDDMPGTVLVDTGALDTHTATGFVEATINQALTPGLYWLAYKAETAAPTVRGTATSLMPSPDTSSANMIGSSALNVLSQSGLGSAAFANNPTVVLDTSTPLIWLRFA